VAEVVGLEDLISREPTPDFAAQVAEEFQRLRGTLGDRELRSLAVRKMEGYTTNEIAAKLDCVPRTIERRLRLIRRLWEQEFTAQGTDS
jgi:DNA-directed RNA polymerase specialized sigma24 family protein